MIRRQLAKNIELVFLKSLRISILDVLIFIPAMTYAAAKSFYAGDQNQKKNFRKIGYENIRL